MEVDKDEDRITLGPGRNSRFSEKVGFLMDLVQESIVNMGKEVAVLGDEPSSDTLKSFVWERHECMHRNIAVLSAVLKPPSSTEKAPMAG